MYIIYVGTCVCVYTHTHVLGGYTRKAKRSPTPQSGHRLSICERQQQPQPAATTTTNKSNNNSANNSSNIYSAKAAAVAAATTTAIQLHQRR